jgi:RNA polymerase sigma factor (sigma-70 family)
MPHDRDELIPTRASLLARIKNLEDHESWQDFFDTYWKLIYGVCVKRGLSPFEAEDVVQETMCAAMKSMPEFNYNRSVGSIKSWLLNMVRWRIADQFRKRSLIRNLPAGVGVDGSDGLDELVDKRAEDLQAVWDQQWEQALLEAAVDKTKRTIDPQKYRVFDLLMNHQWPAAKVAENLSMSVDQVYLVKHRVNQMVKAEVERLKQHMI